MSYNGHWTARGGLFLAQPGNSWSIGRNCTKPPAHRPWPPWLVEAAGYLRAGDGWELVDRSARARAVLRPVTASPYAGGAHVEFGGDDDLTPEERAASNATSAAPLPAGITPARPSDVPGTWAPPGALNAVCGPREVEFYADGKWGSEESMHAGHWVLGGDGLALGTDSPTVRTACSWDGGEVESPVNDVHEWMQRLARLGRREEFLVLIDAAGNELGRLERVSDPSRPRQSTVRQ